MNKKQTEKAIASDVKKMIAEKGDIEKLFEKWNEKWHKPILVKAVRNLRKKSNRKIEKEHLKIVKDTYFGIEPHSLIDALIGEAVTHAVILGGIWDITYEEMVYIATHYPRHSWDVLQTVIKQLKDEISREDLEVNIGPSMEFMKKNRTRIRNFKLSLSNKKEPVIPHLNSYIDKKLMEWERKHSIKISKDSNINLEPVRGFFPRLENVEYTRVTDFVLLGKLQFTVTELESALEELISKDYEKDFIRRSKDIITRIKTYKDNVIDSVYDYDITRKEYEFQQSVKGYEEPVKLSLEMAGLEYSWKNFKEVKSYLEDLKKMS
ncbi:hypothetical protein, partial [Ilyobacter sp.]|uniref:hypothetical protein n=1 Tax=Ilyobacter sp. TaxID=3100343 RepID=UPI0035651CF1